MDFVHLHLLTNHLPVFAVIFSVMLFIAGEYFKSRHLSNAALAGFIIAALGSFVAYQTGERAEHILIDAGIIDIDWVEPHEEAAGRANIAMILLGIIALGALLLDIFKGALPVFLRRLLLLLGLVCIVMISYRSRP
jgi:glycerol-3-phosphate acyltransferase PlsY